jgi:hypothetical protein
MPTALLEDLVHFCEGFCSDCTACWDSRIEEGQWVDFHVPSLGPPDACRCRACGSVLLTEDVLQQLGVEASPAELGRQPLEVLA